MKYNITDIKDYIVLEHPTLFREYLVVWIFLISFFGIIMAVCDPFTPYIFNIMVTIIVIMDLFAIFIIFNVEKWQKLYILFVGIYSFAISIIFYMSFIKTIYFILNIKSLLLFAFTITFYILILLLSFMMLKKALKTGYFSGTGKKKGKSIGVVAGMSGAGVFLGRMLIGSTNYQTIMIVLAFLFLFLSYIMILGILNIYKYYLIKKYEEYVQVYKISKKKKC